ncbi:DUF2235 domain-containing protein [Dechloromonas sp. XY25]|uniref:DUF2235 domain-containing protein n=1 Tax=Dechloromonas hankyongensis TaxID=2908002 RepID=A0ABS9K1G5_9RHOO|nr:DUF2235 domain-containing protein [Dechloromonas hankyongensis]MCG2577020.1 DUF2235 domain-containing protein [Dechloromonas hankyongensis]
MSAKNPTPPQSTALSAKAQQEVVARYAKTAASKSDQPTCCKRVRIGLFFDGTNNNMDRDRPSAGHSNIVRLFDTFPDEPGNGDFAHYIPGVGTPFSKIGELTETKEGKAYGKGGAARIHWGLIQVLNALHRTADLGHLVPDPDALTAVNDPYQLKDAWSLFSGKRTTWFQGKVASLQAKLEKNPKPKITHIQVSVFGFSRGAAEARAFCNWLVEICDKKGGGLKLASIPLTIDFLGVFDTVASVGLADSFPLPVNGHFDWADGTMRVPQEVARCLHLVAAHEIRASFPLNTGRDGKAYAGNVNEFVYPGAHSNLGGGYAPGEQGRSRRGVASLLSQIPLVHMYNEARQAGVPLVSLDKVTAETRSDFEIDDTLRSDFSAYLKLAGVGAAKVEKMLEDHMHYYRRYKAVTADWETPAMKASSEQDRQDLQEASGDFRKERDRLRAKENLSKLNDPRIKVTLSERDKQLLLDLKTPVHTDVTRFLDNYVHDSHAGFYLAGPVTKYDKEQEIKRVEGKAKAGEKLNNWETKVLKASRAGKPFPLMTDAEQWDMLNGNDIVVRANTSTRREGDAYFRQRTVFDKS